MEELLKECARLGVEVDEKIERIARLQDLKREAESCKEFLEQEGETTAVVDAVIEGIACQLAADEGQEPT